MSKIEFYKHYIVTSNHAYTLVNWEEIEEWYKLPFLQKMVYQETYKRIKKIKPKQR